MDAVVLRLGPDTLGRRVFVGPAGSRGRPREARFRLDARARRWRLEGTPGDAQHRKTVLEPLFIEFAQDPCGHPDLEAEVFWREDTSVATTKMEARGFTSEEEFQAFLNSSRQDPCPGVRVGEVDLGQAGTTWLLVDGAQIPLAVVPRHLLASDKVLARDEVRTAMGRLETMLEDLERWSDSADLHSPPTEGDSRTRSTVSGIGKKPWLQRLRRLHHLLFGAGGVVAAWQGLMADPVVLLESLHPVEPMHRARHPVLSGSRGPWTLADGWSPFNPTGVVRNRLVRRTGDTPPHRLAVGLARRVLEEARDIRSDAGIHLDGNGADLDAIRAAAENVLVSPSFSEVPVHAEVHLDSPSLQMNARCRPLLQAWDTLQQGLGRRLDGAFEHAMSKPLARANLLYEHWCFVTLCERVSAHVGAKLPHPLIRSLSSWVQLEEDPNGRGRILEWITDQGETTWKVYHSCDGGVDIFDDGDGSHLGEPRKEGSLCSWSPASNPDGIFVLEREGECPVLHAWDAKYRNLSKNRFKSGYLYQAHAYRDALTYCDAQCSWSIVLHPHHEACGDLELWKSTDSRHPGGVALFPLPPRLLHRSGDDVNKKNEETREKIAEVFRLLEEHTARRCE